MWSHQGVYGLYVSEDALLVQRKQRGPYAGWLDLPGGKLEEGETYEQTLQREFLEEIGFAPEQISDWCSFSFDVPLDSQGNSITFNHWGVCCLVAFPGVSRESLTQDSEFLPLSEITKRTDVSPLVRTALKVCGLLGSMSPG